jgi:hypothetical protein
MPYCITLRSRTNASITAWYDGSRSRWSTDHTRQKLFDKKRGAKPVCHELRRLCPRNAKVINIEPLMSIGGCEADSPHKRGNEDRWERKSCSRKIGARLIF